MRETTVIDRSPAPILKEPNPFFTIRIDKQRSLLLAYSIFVLLVLFEPDYIATTPCHLLFQIAKCAAALLVIIVFFVQKVNLNALLLGTAMFEGLLLLSTIVNGSAIDIWIKDCAYIIILMLFAQTVMEMDAQILPLALSIVLGLYTHINTVCRLLYPLGMYTNSLGFRNCWFLGYDNPSCMVIHLAITVALFRILYYKGRFLVWDWSVLVSGCWFIFVQRIATAIVAEFFFFVFLTASRNGMIRNLFSKGTLIVMGSFLLFFLLQLANIQENLIISHVFKVLGKSATFSSRVKIWSVAWREIQDGGWILGRGMQNSAMYLRLFGGHIWINPHSYYLQVIYEGGFPAFAALFGVLICAAVRFDKGKYDHAYMVFLAGLLAVMMMWQVEAYGDLIKYGFVILSLMYNASLLIQREETDVPPRIQFTFHSPIKHLS